MSKKRRGNVVPDFTDISISPDAQRGILVVFLYAFAIVSVLAIFGAAGALGQVLDKGLVSLFGWDRIFLPALFIIFATKILFPEKIQLHAAAIIGIILFTLVGNGTIELLTREIAPTSLPWVSGGGFYGMILASSLYSLMGFWAALVMLIALLLVSLILIFNTSLYYLAMTTSFFGAPLRWLFGFFGHKKVETAPVIHGLSAEVSDEEKPRKFDVKGVEAVAALPIKHRIFGGPDEKSEESSEPETLVKRPRQHVEVPLDLLLVRTGKPDAGDIEGRMERIRRTFEQFGIPVEMGDVSVGPTVTQFTLHPAEGIKLSRITGLSNDLAMALAAHPIRIEAPIPGKSLVGIEVPNETVSIVTIREVLESPEFHARKNTLEVGLGKDVSGKAWTANVTKMPHMLVAGATGSGKSVCLNTLIISLLYQNGPDDLRFIMVDPKRVELQVYNGIPHLITPVITDVPKTINALKWSIGEMERRFDLLSKAGFRDIASYNAASPEKLPYLVLVIDELADLMVSAGQEVEALIIRLAQMARAVGIHLILATQRPSVDVITGLIKANITTRIAFSVASGTDSRTILDSLGAEKLLGRGDMLFVNAELSKPKRIQGCLVTDDEIRKVVEYVKTTSGPPNYLNEVTERGKNAPGSSSVFSHDDDGDSLLIEAQDTIMRAGKASASLLQRRLKVGYSRAARLLDLLEERGVIGPGDGAKPREILITQEGVDMLPDPDIEKEVYSEDIGEEEIEEEKTRDDTDA